MVEAALLIGAAGMEKVGGGLALVATLTGPVLIAFVDGRWRPTSCF